MDEKKPELTPEVILEAKIIARLQKQVKHIPSEKQQKHIDKLAQAKKGTTYVEKVEPVTKEDPPTQDTPDVHSCAKKVKKPAKKKVEPKVEPKPESSSESSEEPVPKKRVEKIPKKVVRSKTVPKQANIEPEPPRSLFRKSLL